MDKKWWTLIAVCAGMFMLLLDVTIVIVAQPAIQDGLHASFTEVQWVLDAYALTLASLLLTAGVLADRYGRKRLFQIGLVIFTLGSLLCGVAQDPLMLIVSRSGQGVGGAIMFATSLALLGQSFRGRDRGVAFGVWGAVTGVSTALGPVPRRGDHHQLELARHLPGQRADRRARRRADRLAGRGIEVAAPHAARLGRVRAADHRPGQPDLRAHPGRRDQLVGRLASSSAWRSRRWRWPGSSRPSGASRTPCSTCRCCACRRSREARSRPSP